MINYPEERLAERLIDKNGIAPPFDLINLVNNYASVEEIAFPWNIDGIILYLKVSGKRPKIFINKSSARRRKRFTLAHELGHVVIPWHVGNIVDTTDINSRDDEYISYECEANRFAAELLMPTKWIIKLSEKIISPAEIFNFIIKNADASPSAVCIKMITSLPPGYIYAEVDDKFEVINSGRSKNTTVHEPSISKDVSDYEKLYEFGQAYPISIDGYTYVWWKLDNLKCPSINDNREWREILDSVMPDIIEDKSQWPRFKQRLNGHLAVVNDKVKGDRRTKDALYSACIQKLSDNPLFNDFRNHKYFDVFLLKRVESFLQGVNK